MMLHDRSLEFRKCISKYSNYDKAIVLGCGHGLNHVEQEDIGGDALTIGLNRSFYKLRSDVLLYMDKKTEREIIDVDFEYDVDIISMGEDRSQKEFAAYWNKNKCFDNYDNGLFWFKNTLVPALHLCVLAGIRDIVLVGFDFDSKQHFYEEGQFWRNGWVLSMADLPFETSDVKPHLSTHLFGYTLEKFFGEYFDYLCMVKKCEISFTDESIFLSRYESLKKVDKIWQ